MIRVNDPQECCGCTACASVCAHDAISMQPDTLGFLYPAVDENKCVDCGLCEKVCAFNNHYDTNLNLTKPDVYAARHKDLCEVETSRSGAAFIASSDYVLEQGGVVFGAGLNEHFRVVHKRATSKEQRDEFKGSKYVQSNLCGVFRQIKQDLKDGKIVLFSGTPCQTAGLASYIGQKLREKLFLVDIVCHGVPSPYVWGDYLAYLEKKQKSKIVRLNFRDKQRFGWKAHRETFEFANGVKRSFPHSFYRNILFRYSCGNCFYCNIHRPSDITLADFWSWKKIDSEINSDDKGISLLFINTEKGRKLFEQVQNKMNIKSVRLADAMQPNHLHPSAVHPQRMKFEHDYKIYGFEYIAKKYGDIGFHNWHKRTIIILKDIVRKIVIKLRNK